MAVWNLKTKQRGTHGIGDSFISVPTFQTPLSELSMTYVRAGWLMLVRCGEDLLWSPHLPVSSPHNGAPPRPPAAFLRGVAWKNNQGMFKCRSYLLGTITINILQRGDTRRLGTQKHRSILQTSKSKFGWRKNTVADYLHLFVASMSVIDLPVV